MSKPKSATAGEKMVMRRLKNTLPGICNCLHDFRTKAVLAEPRADAKAHDSALRRAVRESWAANWEGTSVFKKKKELEQKYNVKL